MLQRGTPISQSAQARLPLGSKATRRVSHLPFAAAAVFCILIEAAGCGLAGSANVGTGGGTTPGTLTPISETVSFGNVAVGTSASQPLTITNTGNTSVTISSVSVSGTGLSASGGSNVTLAPNQSVTINVSFSPTKAQTVQGSLSITSNASNASLAISLTGTGTQAQISANMTSIVFGTVTVGSNDSQPILLQNNGNTTLTFSQIAVSGSGFSQTGLSTSTTIPAGGSTTFDAVFAPTSGNAVTGSITLTTNGAPSSLVINLSGTGATVTLSLSASPPSLSFGDVSDGGTNSQPTLLTNNGNSNITISSVTVTGAGFSASGISNGAVLTPGQSATLNVTFAPTSAGAVSGAGINIASNATNSPMTIGLSGTGTHVVKLQWTPSSTPNVTYNVFRGTSQGGEGPTPINPSPMSTTSYTDTSVSGGQTYFYDVESVNSDGSSGPSTEVEINVPTP